MLMHLNLSWSDVEKLPDYVVRLTNLETLDLSGCKRLVALPVNIGSLKDLRELEVDYCNSLEDLPREVGRLTRLRCIDLSGTRIEVLPDESCISNLCNLESIHFGRCEVLREIKNWPKLRIFRHDNHNKVEMPRGIETLTCLEVLDCYAVRNKEGNNSGTIELANLNSLQELKIIHLELVRGSIDAERAKLKDKINLRKLALKWESISGSISEDDDEMEFDEVLEGLEPNPNLRYLEINNFPGLQLPKWMGSSHCLRNVVEISVRVCNKCEKLPALGMLPCLRVLRVWDIGSVKCLGVNFYYQQDEEDERISISSSNFSGSAVNATRVSLFPSLIVLEFYTMENLEEWVFPQLPIYDSFLSLEKLHIYNCPKLRSTPNSFPFLKELILKEINGKTVTSMFTTGGRLSSLTSIDISESPDLIYLPVGVLLQNSTPHLQLLSIDSCDKFQGFLEDDVLNDYNNKDGDDEDFEALSSFSCPTINSSSNNISNSLRSLKLSECPVLTLFPDLRSFTSLRELIIFQCDKLKELIPYDLKQYLTFLEVLRVDFIQRQYEHLPDPTFDWYLVNLMVDQENM